MCGIFCVVEYGNVKQEAGQGVFAGLKALEYRGYDSWGVAVVEGGELQIEKHVGKISGVASLALPNSRVALGHTRWATHGGVTQKNAHPHLAPSGAFALVQNGVVENYLELRRELEQEGAVFQTETDTEVIVLLIDGFLAEGKELRKSVAAAWRRLKGRNTIALLTKEGRVIAARQGSPLLLGRQAASEGDEVGVSRLILSSDVLSLSEQASEYLVLENNELIEIGEGGFQLFSLEGSSEELGSVSCNFEPLQIEREVGELGEFPHFMLKEIHDTPAVIRAVIEQPTERMEELVTLIRRAVGEKRQVYCIGSGTAGIAAGQMAYLLRQIAHVPSVALVGADALEYLEMMSAGDVLIAPSQSGETADVLEVLELAKAKGVTIVTYVNMLSSSMTRLADLSFLAGAGPEKCVLSTKVFVSQVAWGYLVASMVAGRSEAAVRGLEKLATEVGEYLRAAETRRALHHLAEQLCTSKSVYLLAKGANFQIIREGMVKIIEGSYIHAHALPAGDLKHYAITLVEEGTPVIVVTSNDDLRSDVLTASHEVRARGARVIEIGPVVSEEAAYGLRVPDVGELGFLMNVIPLQLLAYELAVLLGHDVDHPRNIAKSVTVK